MNDYYTVSEYSKIVGKDTGHIRRLLTYGKLVGEKIGNQWLIPKDVKYPEDARVKNGNYRNWRKTADVRANNPKLFKVLHRMCQALYEIYGENLEKIVLYGSYARGDQTDESDADIAVILRDDRNEQMHDRMIDIVVDYELECGVTLSTVQIELQNYNEWKKTLPYYKNIEQEGIILWRAA